MMSHVYRAKLVLILVAFVACAASVYASYSTYSQGFYDGMMNSDGGTDPSGPYSVWLRSPTQDNWDYYWGYNHGYNGMQEDYNSVPAMPSSSDSCSTTEALLAFQQVNNGSNRIVRNFRRLARGFRLGGSRLGRLRTKAGDLFQDVTFSVQGSRAHVDDDLLGGSGHDTEAGFLLSSRVGDKFNLSFGIAQDWYRIKAADWDESTTNYDLILSYRFAEHFSAGVFANFSQIDIEDHAGIPGEDRDRWGGGAMASYDVDLTDRVNFGLTGALTSMNKTSVGRLFDDEDSAGLVLSDLNVELTEALSLNLYASYFGLLDRETGGAVQVGDGSYWTMGVDLGIRLGKKSDFSIGYGTTAADNDHEEDRLNLEFTVEF